LEKGENGSREEEKLGCNSALFPGKGEHNFSNIDYESSVFD